MPKGQEMVPPTFLSLSLARSADGSSDRALDACELLCAAEAALWVDAVRIAAKDVRRRAVALRLPIVPVRRCRRAGGWEGAQRGRAGDLLEVANTTKAAAEVFSVSLAAQHAIRASAIPEVRRGGFVVEGASGRGRHDGTWVFRARNSAIVGELATEAALDIVSIRQATYCAKSALCVPIIRQMRRIAELAP